MSDILLYMLQFCSLEVIFSPWVSQVFPGLESISWFWYIIQRFSVYFSIFFMDKHIAALNNWSKVFNFFMVIVFLITMKEIYFFEGFFPDIFIKHASLMFLAANFHLSLCLPEDFLDSLSFFLFEKVFVLLKKLLFSFYFTHSSLGSSSHFSFIFLFVTFWCLSFDPLEKLSEGASFRRFFSYACFIWVEFIAIAAYSVHFW